jgi:hypothetical protein
VDRSAALGLKRMRPRMGPRRCTITASLRRRQPRRRGLHRAVGGLRLPGLQRLRSGRQYLSSAGERFS